MQIHKCNGCSKVIEEPFQNGHIALIGLAKFGSIDLCGICSRGVINSLERLRRKPKHKRTTKGNN